jgi:hypothetical protein
VTERRERLLRHLEAHLGPSSKRTTGRDLVGGEAAVCSIVTFLNQPVDDAFTLVTVGLSDRPLAGPEGEQVWQELLICGWTEDLDDRLYRRLFDVALTLREEGESANPGAVTELDGALSDRGELQRVFFYPPTYHADELATVPAPPGEAGEGEIEIVWLLPVTEKEALLVETDGPEAFEAYLAREDPDLLDLGRG